MLRSSSELPFASSSSRANTSAIRAWSPPQAELKKVRSSDPRRSTAPWKRLWIRSHRALSIFSLSIVGCSPELIAEERASVCLVKLMCQPGPGCPPLTEYRCFGNLEQLGGLGDVQTAEESPLDHHRLARLNPRQLIQSCVQRQQVLCVPRRLVPCVVKGDGDRSPSSPLQRVPTAGRLDQNLAHCACGDPLEVQQRRGGKARRAGQLQPSLIDQGGGIERSARITSQDGGRQAPQLLVSHGKKLVDPLLLGRLTLVRALPSACHSNSLTSDDSFPAGQRNAKQKATLPGPRPGGLPGGWYHWGMHRCNFRRSPSPEAWRAAVSATGGSTST